jgi:hypothetical protein
LENIILGDKDTRVHTRIRLESAPEHANFSLLFKIETKNFIEANGDKHWIDSINEELNQIEKNETWELVPRKKDKNVIGTKWVFKNKLNEDGQVIINKERLVCKDYSQVEGIDLEETFSPVSRTLKSIKWMSS